MANRTAKLIRQLSLISYLLAECEPVTASEIKRDVKEYGELNGDTFVRQFSADRAELEAVGIVLGVENSGLGAGKVLVGSGVAGQWLIA